MRFTPSPLARCIALVLSTGFSAAALADTVQISGQTLSSTQTLSGERTLLISSGAGIATSGKAIDLDGATSGNGVVLDNSGSISSSGGRAIDSSGSTSSTRDYQLINRASGLINASDDAIRLNTDFADGSVLIDNAGQIRSQTGQTIDLDKLRSDVPVEILNRAGGLIRSEGQDAIRPGANASIDNYGEISSADMIDADTKYDGIDFQDATGGSVTNRSGALISGGRHGITTDTDVLLINEAGASLIGRNGSGFGSDGDGTVINAGRITGAYSGLTANGDGDGVDIDFIGHIENQGSIEGTGAGGVDKGGQPNGSEGIAMGGGLIVNYADGLISGASRGILVDDGSAGSAYAATVLENHGSIRGLNGSGVTLIGDYSDSVLNAGLISGSNGIALELGRGDDALELLGGSQFDGLVDGGDDYDSLILGEGASGSFGNSQGFEWLQVNEGHWTLSSDDFSEGGEVLSGAELTNQGRIGGDLRVEAGAAYGGSGQIGGDFALDAGSTLKFAVSPNGNHTPVTVGGRADLAGANLQVLAGAGSYPLQSRYQVLNAADGVSGQFASVSSNLAFLTPELSYQNNEVELQLTRNDLAFADLANNASTRNLAASLEAQGSGLLYNTLLASDTGTVGNALEQLAGSSNASLSSATLAGSSQVGGAMQGALLQLVGGAGDGLQTAMLRKDAPRLAATGVPSSARNLNDPSAQGRLWVQGLGSHGHLDGNDGSSGLDQDTRGGVIGADWAINPDWRLGLLSGYSRTDLDGSGISGDIDSLHLGAYALRQSGALALRLGAAYSRHDGSSEREVAFVNDRPRGDYDADSLQAFAELGYHIGSGRLSAEPFVNLGYQRYERDAYDEKGGAAALHVDSQEQDNLTSTFGVRVARLDTLDNGMSFTPRLSVGWRHVYGDVSSSTRQAFLSGGSGFSVEGSALDRNSLLLETGVDIGISATQQIGLGYSGELGTNAQNHALIAQWQMGF